MALKMKLLSVSSINNASDTVLFPTATGPWKSYLLKNIILTNKGTTSVKVNLSVAMQGTSLSPKVPVIPIDSVVVPPSGQVIVDDEITLAPSDASTILAASVDTLYYNCTGALDCVIAGLERDL